MEARKPFAMAGRAFPLQSVGDHGVVYFAYSNNGCDGNNRYVKEVLHFTRRLKSLSPHVQIAFCFHVVEGGARDQLRPVHGTLPAA